MTSISAASSSSYQSPLQKLQQELQAELSSGKISSGDQDALSSALTDIDASLQADRSSQSRGSRPSPDDMKSKIDDLISAQVSSGKLTSDQATELKGVFESAFADGGPGGAGGPKGAGGPPPGGPPPSDSADSTDSTDDTDSATSISDIMKQFLDSLKQSLEASSSNAYSASGTSTTASSSKASFTALLIDYQT